MPPVLVVPYVALVERLLLLLDGIFEAGAFVPDLQLAARHHDDGLGERLVIAAMSKLSCVFALFVMFACKAACI